VCVCVCVCVFANNVNLAHWFILTLSKSRSKVKLEDQSSRLQEKTSWVTAGMADRGIARAENKY